MSEHQHMEEHDHSAHDPAIFRRLFWVNLALTIPTLAFSTGLQDILGFILIINDAISNIVHTSAVQFVQLIIRLPVALEAPFDQFVV